MVNRWLPISIGVGWFGIFFLFVFPCPGFAYGEFTVGEGAIQVAYSHPAQDDHARVLLEAVIVGCSAASERLGIVMTAPLFVELAPTVRQFRDRTSRGPYFAASYRHGRLVVQPLRKMLSEGTLIPRMRHECTHHLLEQRYPTGLPVWFEEGLAVLLFGPQPRLQAEHRMNPKHFKRPWRLHRWFTQALSRRRHDQLYLLFRDMAALLALRFGEEQLLLWVRDGSMNWRLHGLWKQVRNAGNR